MLKVFIVLLFSYLIGSLLLGDLISRLKKIDLRHSGSGNVGATNVFRSMGAFYGTIVLAGDTLKGVAAVLLGNLLGKYHGFDLAILTGLLAIVGHNWSIFARFRGGKGIATSLGVTYCFLSHRFLPDCFWHHHFLFCSL
jgi:glycerol-3-phosphate acyltransferase PlsY